jgi:chromosome segregation ATPase
MSDKPEDRIEDLDKEIEEVEDELDEVSEEESESAEDKKDDRVYTKADIDKAAKRRQAALKKARDLENELKTLKAEHETESDRLVREAAEKAIQQAEDTYKPALVRKELFYQMATLGLSKDQIPDLVDLIKMKEIDIDEDFNVLGVEEEIERLKNKFPRLFETDEPDPDKREKKAPRKRPVPKGDGADKKAPETKTTAADQIRNRLLKIS